MTIQWLLKRVVSTWHWGPIGMRKKYIVAVAASICTAVGFYVLLCCHHPIKQVNGPIAVTLHTGKGGEYASVEILPSDEIHGDVEQWAKGIHGCITADSVVSFATINCLILRTDTFSIVLFDDSMVINSADVRPWIGRGWSQFVVTMDEEVKQMAERLRRLIMEESPSTDQDSP